MGGLTDSFIRVPKTNVGYPTVNPVSFEIRTRLDTDAPKVVTAYSVPSRRLEDHIRQLCSKVSNADDKNDESAISELKAGLHEHTQRLTKLAAENLLDKERPNRRKNLNG